MKKNQITLQQFITVDACTGAGLSVRTARQINAEERINFANKGGAVDALYRGSAPFVRNAEKTEGRFYQQMPFVGRFLRFQSLRADVFIFFHLFFAGVGWREIIRLRDDDFLTDTYFVRVDAVERD